MHGLGDCYKNTVSRQLEAVGICYVLGKYCINTAQKESFCI